MKKIGQKLEWRVQKSCKFSAATSAKRSRIKDLKFRLRAKFGFLLGLRDYDYSSHRRWFIKRFSWVMDEIFFSLSQPKHRFYFVWLGWIERVNIKTWCLIGGSVRASYPEVMGSKLDNFLLGFLSAVLKGKELLITVNVRWSSLQLQHQNSKLSSVNILLTQFENFDPILL